MGYWSGRSWNEPPPVDKSIPEEGGGAIRTAELVTERLSPRAEGRP